MNDMRIPPGLPASAAVREPSREPAGNDGGGAARFDQFMDRAFQPEPVRGQYPLPGAPTSGPRDDAASPVPPSVPPRETPRGTTSARPQPQPAGSPAPRRDGASAAPRDGHAAQVRSPLGDDDRPQADSDSSARPPAAADVADTVGTDGQASDRAAAAGALAALPVTAPNQPIDQVLEELRAATAALAAASAGLAEAGSTTTPAAAPPAGASATAAFPPGAPAGTATGILPAQAGPWPGPAGTLPTPTDPALAAALPAGASATAAFPPGAPAGTATGILPAQAGLWPGPAGTLPTPTDPALADAARKPADVAPTPGGHAAAADASLDRLGPLPAPAADRLLEDFERRFERSLAAVASGHREGFTPGTPQALAAAVIAAPMAPGSGAPIHGAVFAGIAASVGSPAFIEELSHRVLLFASQRVQSAELTLSPAELGPIKVSIEVHGQEASLAFTAQHAGTRAAIEDALPRLREMLAGQGLQLAQAQVGDQSRQDPGRPGDGQARRNRNLDVLRAGERSGAISDGAATAAFETRSPRLIDIRV
jgi:flagellar hook-length control protein FliK